MARRDSDRASVWRGHVGAQGSSGVSVHAYCAAQGLAVSSFYYWKRALRLRDGDAGPGASSGRRAGQLKKGARRSGAVEPAKALSAVNRTERRPRSGAAPRFAEVAPPMRLGEGPGAGGVEVVLGNDRRLRVGRGFDEETLRRVVAALEAMAC